MANLDEALAILQNKARRAILERLVRDIRTIDKIIGDGEKRVWPSEIPVMKKLRNMD